MYADHILHGTTFSQTTLATALCSFSDLKYKHLRRPLPPSSFLSFFFFPRACHSILFCLPHSLTHPPFPLTNSLLCLVLQARRCCRHDGQGCQRWACPGCRRQGCCTSHILALDVFLVFSLIPFVCLFVCLFVLFVCLFVLFVFFFFVCLPFLRSMVVSPATLNPLSPPPPPLIFVATAAHHVGCRHKHRCGRACVSRERGRVLARAAHHLCAA